MHLQWLMVTLMGVPVVEIGPVRVCMRHGVVFMPMRVFCRGWQAGMIMRVMTVILVPILL